MVAKVILNPYANRWNAQSRRRETETALKEAGVNYELAETEGPGHGTLLAAQAVRDGFSPIIAAGGDGTISEVINGIAQTVGAAGEWTPLGVMPLGSANDLVVNLKMPVDLKESARAIAGGKTCSLDIGWVENECTPLRFFDNNSAMGLEPSITLIQQKITRIHGVVRYLLAAILGVLRSPKWTVHMEWDGGNYNGPVSLVTVGNGAITGGLFYMTPGADPLDHKLTFVYGYIANPLRMLALLPRTMKTGKGSYIEHPAIHQQHCTWLRIRCEQPSPLHADGEIQSEAVKEIEYNILPGKLPVLIP